MICFCIKLRFMRHYFQFITLFVILLFIGKYLFIPVDDTKIQFQVCCFGNFLVD